MKRFLTQIVRIQSRTFNRLGESLPFGFLWKVLGAHTDFVVLFAAVGDDVIVFLKLMALVYLQLFFGKRLDRITGGDFKAMSHGAAVGKQIESLGVTRLTKLTALFFSYHVATMKYLKDKGVADPKEFEGYLAAAKKEVGQLNDDVDFWKIIKDFKNR